MSQGPVLNENMPTSEEQMDAAIAMAWREDIGSGDVTSAACIPLEARERAGFLVKGSGVIAGLEVARKGFCVWALQMSHSRLWHPMAMWSKPGDVVAWASGPARQILTAERLALNFMQRMSGIAAGTRQVVALLEGTRARVSGHAQNHPWYPCF